MSNRKLCPLCKSRNSRDYQAMPGYVLASCNSCFMIWDPFITNVSKTIYNKNYFVSDNPKGGYKNYFKGMKINRRTFKIRIEKIAKLVDKKQNMLDLGCALGDCLLEAKKQKWRRIEGVDLSRYASLFAKKRGLKVKCGTLESLKLKKDKYNVVLCQDVIEHLENPVETLKLVSSILRPKGILYIITPNVKGFLAKLLRKNWYHYKPGEHLVYFSPQTIKKALEKTSFANIKIKPAVHIMSIEYILERLAYYSPSVTNFFLKISNLLKISKFSFKIYTGEIEVIAYNNKNK